MHSATTDGRAQLHAMWGRSPVQGSTPTVDAAARSPRMLALAAPQPGERVLELACGPGGLGIATTNGSRRPARWCSRTWPPR
jgi:hypothetical protein